MRRSLRDPSGSAAVVPQVGRANAKFHQTLRCRRGEIMPDARLLVSPNVLTVCHYKPYRWSSSMQHCVTFWLARRPNQWFVCKIITVGFRRPPPAVGHGFPHGRTGKSPLCSSCFCVFVQSSWQRSWRWSPNAAQTHISASGFNIYTIPLSCCSHSPPVHHPRVSNQLGS